MLTIPPIAELKPAGYADLARRIRAGEAGGLRPLRVAILASHTLGFIEPFLVVEGARAGYRIECYFGPFGQFEQEVLDTTSGLWAFAPDLLVMTLQPEEADPELVSRFYSSALDGAARLSRLARRLSDCATQFRARSRAPILVANYAPIRHLPLGVFDANAPESLTSLLGRSGEELLRAIRQVPDAAVWDYHGLVTECGLARWSDPRLVALARIPVSAACQPLLAAHLARTIRGVLLPPAKCLVLDLDNTLWGGVIGDDGMAGIQLGDDYPGSAFKALQRAALGLRDRGVLLAVVSKNNLEVVEEAFRSHPEMLIRKEDLAAWRINWNPKSANLRQIATELNIGADALVLFDDNPVERAEVRAGAPEVRVIEVPADPLGYVEALLASAHFDQTGLSEEDRQRGALYRQDKLRQELEATAQSPEEFLRDLQMVAEVGRADDRTLGRIAQLVGKTNQFNLTTRRHSAAELEAMSRDPAAVVAWLRLTDRFSDQGLVGVGVVKLEGEHARIDTFLMSCRVMNRQVERALAAYLADAARALGARTILGEFIPTAKNQVVAGFYDELGFRPAGTPAGDSGAAAFVLELGDETLRWPMVIARRDASAP
jgi:FkbH-like protein